MTFALAVLFAGLTARLFLWPPSDDPSRVDAVVVLSGDHGERIAEARRLLAEGVAPLLVYAGTPDSQEVVGLCASGESAGVMCVQPHPDSTRAEARAVGRLTAARGWRSIAVVTSTPHLTRAGILFRRCVGADVELVAAWPRFTSEKWRRVVVHEWAGVIHALTLGRRC